MLPAERSEEDDTPMVTQKVIAVIADAANVPPETITLDRSLAELGIDSLQGLNLLFELENVFNIKVPNPYALNVRSVGDLVTGIEKLLLEGAEQTAG
jgi:acyl carrier protein